ncbi:MAG: AAA family ATPase [Oscillatoriales cyanobacterium SM2_2_1]|nr:AAA family ATPase [Oscillatoriales cyanobacterium SM2_2_1]
MTDLGRGIKFEPGQKTCQLYTGHRGAGKSTELLRLEEDLLSNGFYVVYFAADLEDIDPQDTDYADILNACARNVFEDLLKKGIAKADLLKPLHTWWSEHLPTFEKIVPGLKDFKLDADLSSIQLPFIKISTAFKKGTPDIRKDLRQILEGSTPDLIRVLNEFIKGVRANLPEPYDDLVVIVDNLDRITYKRYANGSEFASNYEKIFIGQGEPLTSLDCHVIYTFPLPLVYSSKGANLRDIYDNQIQVLPMVAVRDRHEHPLQSGIDKMREVLCRRAEKVQGVNFNQLFDSEETLNGLCEMSGGYMRGLLQMMQRALLLSDALPIQAETALRVINEVREDYNRIIQSSEWNLLANVAATKEKLDERYVNLLLNRCVMEYREGTAAWYDVHPTIRGLNSFRQALSLLQEPSEGGSG